MKITVLLSSYNGEKYIKEQIDSILSQDVTGIADLELLVRDDGSSDTTKEILESYAQEGKLKWYTGDNLKTAKSFWDLLAKAGDSDYYSFADQDDLWFKDKLSRAIKALRDRAGGTENKPLLYCSFIQPTDEGLNPIPRVDNRINCYTDFAHSLLYSIAPGCTYVFNAKAREILLRYDINCNPLEMHDWLAHKIVALFGEVILDKVPTMYYRQHQSNVIGAVNTSGLRGFIGRASGILRRRTKTVRRINAAEIYRTYRDLKDEPGYDPHKFECLKEIAFYRTDRSLKRKAIRNRAFRVGGVNDIFLVVLILVNRI